nr:2TM domain-containing protein [uncultured Tyzzerella sp.]
MAKKRVLAKKAFKIHLATYILVSILLVVISLYNGAYWFIFPVLGWGIGIVAHGISLNSVLNSRNEIENELNYLRQQNNKF